MINAEQIDAYADLGDVWMRDQMARLHQQHLQLGCHFRMDADALLSRRSSTARTALPLEIPKVQASASTDWV